MKISEIESKAWTMDGIRIVIRTGESKDANDYTHKNAAQGSWSVTKYLDSRIRPLIGSREVIVLLGNGEQPHGRTLLNSVRESYRHG